MLNIIFASSDFPEYDYYSNSSKNQNNYKKSPSPKYHVEVDEYVHHQVSINTNDDDQDWGYYIDLDTPTPLTANYTKNKNISPTLNLPKKNYTINKPLKYLPVIEEDIYYISNNINNANDANNMKSYMTSDINTASSVISGVTFCATVAFYYFFRNMRN
jgi:hypothetical protein